MGTSRGLQYGGQSHGMAHLLPEVAAGFCRLDADGCDADALSHIEDFLLSGPRSWRRRCPACDTGWMRLGNDPSQNLHAVRRES
jgi:hypothetical protein